MAIQVQAFAERVLFGRTIDDKLDYPREEIVDTVRGPSIDTPGSLARPAHLELREDSSRAQHPRPTRLIDERARGELLHFFANHELLATELMALALLKFPDAPPSFRTGLLHTLREEQTHTRIYMNRMKQCGIEFGELPLSDYFWRSVSSMEDPLDYVTRLSLTFEQANLDYSREYAKIFASVGDPATAAILDRIYRDEIQHVGFGLKWFRRWKAAGKSDWDAFRERLPFPLSPSRAKGNVFNIEGRLKAGLDSTFIEDLQIHQQSRGRTPTVRWFNPNAEFFAARNHCSPIPGREQALQRDLAFLPAYLSRKDDILIVPRRPSNAFLKSVQSAGIPLPEILASDKNGDRDRAPEIERKIGAIRPWAWSPDSLDFFRDTLGYVTRPPSEPSLWNPSIRNLFCKSWAARKARSLSGDATEDWVSPAEAFGEEARSIAELEQLRERWRELGYADAVCKAPFGASGQGNRLLAGNAPASEGFRTWFEETVREQGALLAEPWLNRVFDFSIQFEVDHESPRIVAIARLFNNRRGQFRSVLSGGFGSISDSDLARFLLQRSQGGPRVFQWCRKRLLPWLETILAGSGYSGPLGIDAFAYRSSDGRLLLKPVSEINPRHTMGRVAHELGTRNAGGSIGLLEIVTRSQIRRLGYTDIASFYHRWMQDHPTRTTANSKPQIKSGTLALCDPQQAQSFAALYHVRTSFSELPLGAKACFESSEGR